ncbi:MAG: response regulator transcription factor [Verrucomicrobia bacterium]|nr:response regulator transcription factor [Verrucomicrobiota bacterium]
MSHKKPTKAKRRILIVDDHPLLREGVARLINDQPDLMVCGEAEAPSAALAVADTAKPDLAVVDISLKDQSGLELIKDFKVRFPNLLVLALSVHDESVYAERALRAGARGYVMKREASDKVLEAIRSVLEGNVYISNKIAAGILDKVTGYPAGPARSALDVLSDRETEVLMWIGKGYGSNQIAKQLHISVKTVEAHRANIKLKLNLSSSNELLQCAIGWAQQIGEI